MGEVFAYLAQHTLIPLAVLGNRPGQFVYLLLSLVQLLIQLADSSLVPLQLHQLLPILLLFFSYLIVQFLRGKIEQLLHFGGVELCLAVTPLSKLEIGCLHLYLLVIYHLLCSFFLGVMQSAPLAQQSERIIELFGDLVHLLSMLTLQPFDLSLVDALVVGSFFEQFIIFVPDLDVKVPEFVERLGFYFRLVRVIPFECVLLIDLINILIIFQIVAQLF